MHAYFRREHYIDVARKFYGFFAFDFFAFDFFFFFFASASSFALASPKHKAQELRCRRCWHISLPPHVEISLHINTPSASRSSLGARHATACTALAPTAMTECSNSKSRVWTTRNVQTSVTVCMGVRAYHIPPPCLLYGVRRRWLVPTPRPTIQTTHISRNAIATRTNERSCCAAACISHRHLLHVARLRAAPSYQGA